MFKGLTLANQAYFKEFSFELWFFSCMNYIYPLFFVKLGFYPLITLAAVYCFLTGSTNVPINWRETQQKGYFVTQSYLLILLTLLRWKREQYYVVQFKVFFPNCPLFNPPPPLKYWFPPQKKKKFLMLSLSLWWTYDERNRMRLESVRIGYTVDQCSRKSWQRLSCSKGVTSYIWSRRVLCCQMTSSQSPLKTAS
jgi:hypothetical protein